MRPITVVFETQHEFTALSGVIAELGSRCRTVQVQRPNARRRTRGFFDGSRLVVPDAQVDLVDDGPGRDGAVRQVAAVLNQLQSGAVLVLGDTDSAGLAARASASVGIPVGRLDDDSAPREVSPFQHLNRQAVADTAAVHYVSSERRAQRVREAGAVAGRIVIVGDMASETALRLLPSPDERAEILATAGLTGDHVVAAISKPENVDDPSRLRFILKALAVQGLTVAMPLSPHVARRIHEFGLVEEARAMTNLKLVDRSTFLTFVQAARLVVSDAGSVLREAAALKVPALLVAALDPSPASPEWIADVRFAHRVPPDHMLSAHLFAALDDRTWATRLSHLPNPLGDGLASQRVAMGVLDLITSRVNLPSNALLNAGSGP